MYLNPHPTYRLRRRLAAAVLAAGAVTGIAACTSTPDSPKVSSVATVDPINPNRPTASLAQLEDEYVTKLRAIDVVPDHATAQQARHEGFTLALDVKRSVPDRDQTKTRLKVIQLGDSLMARYGVTEEQAGFWIGAALAVYAHPWSEVL